MLCTLPRELDFAYANKMGFLPEPGTTTPVPELPRETHACRRNAIGKTYDTQAGEEVVEMGSALGCSKTHCANDAGASGVHFAGAGNNDDGWLLWV